MKILRILLCQILLLSALVLTCFPQDSSKEIYVESWATDHLREQKFDVELNSAQNEYSFDVRRWNGVGYKLIFHNIPAGQKDYELEYWQITLNEVLSNKNAKKVKLGCNLLSTEGCGPGGDNINDVRVGILFPREKPTNIELLLNGLYYPIYTKRVIKIKSFYVIIKVNNYKMNESNPKKLDLMNVTVEFKNNFNVEKLKL